MDVSSLKWNIKRRWIMRLRIENFPGEFESLLRKMFSLSGCAVLSIVMPCMLLFGCSNPEPLQPASAGIYGSSLSLDPDIPDAGRFTISARHDLIRSYPEGGGIFLVRVAPADALPEEISLSIKADAALNARIDLNELNRPSGMAEITIRPEQSTDIEVYPIMVYATRLNTTRTVRLNVEMINWPSGDPQPAMDKRDQFVAWLEAEHPEFGRFSGREWFPYMTYPGILVVEHWTFLDQDWEMRICFHVMIPPYDWSMILLRPRGEWDPIFAARRESDGTIHEIPISDYPFFSY
jgi:hypothetical protein